MTVRMPLLLVPMLFGALMSACQESDIAGSGSAAGLVNVNDDYFSPTIVHPDMAGNVSWLWAGVNPHNVIFADNMSNSITQTDGTHDRNFSSAAPGNYQYQCTLHGGMTGTVVVP